MNNILSYIIIDILLLALSILLFLKYNNGKGGPLGSRTYTFTEYHKTANN